MLSREVMGVLALAVLWVNTLLVVAASARELRALVGLWRALHPIGPGETGVGSREGRIESGLGPAGELAAHRIAQVGRQAADDHDRRAIAFADRSHESSCFGGTIALADGAVRVEPADSAEVWPDPGALKAAAAAGASFERAYEQARKAKGYDRTVQTELGSGARVWIAGAFAAEGAETVVRPAPRIGLIVAAFDPRRWCAGKIAAVAGFIVGALALAAGSTAVALWPPHFGTISTVGGALCLAYFLLIQPAGTAVRNAVLRPSRAVLRGSWVEPMRSGDGDAIALAPPPR